MSDENHENGKSGIKVITRAAAVLRSLKEHPDGMSLGQIAHDIGLPRSTVQRIVGALQAERFVIANTSGAGVRLGPEIASLAQASRFNTAEQCRPFLLKLTQQTGETSDLSVFKDRSMIFVDQVPGTHRLRTVSSVGEIFPLTTTANGLACLALLPRQNALELAQHEAGRNGNPFDVTAFSSRLDQISDKGIAFDNDEHSEGISAIGFAFQDVMGEIYAISVPVPTSRFLASQDKIEQAVIGVVHELSNSNFVQD